MNNSIELHEDDLCAILTVDGEFIKIISDYDFEDICTEGDLIHEFMIEAMKEEDAKVGAWLWHIDNDCETMYADSLDE
jgi:hypothetical protein